MEKYRRNKLQHQVAVNITELRKQKSVLQKELALQLGITPRELSFIENGHVDMQLSMLERIAGALKVQVGDLFRTPKAKMADEHYFNEKAIILQTLAKEPREIMLNLLDILSSNSS